MNSPDREAVAERALEYSTAEQTEIGVYYSHSELTRFTHNYVHQNVAASDVAVRVRAIVGKRTGVASTNALDDESLQAVVTQAIEMANLAPEDPDLVRLPSGGPVQTPPGAYIQETADAAPRLRAEMCDAMFKQAEQRDYWCAGFVSTADSGITILNSSGARASFDGTDASLNVKINAPDSTGYAEAYDNDVTRIDAAAVGKRAADKARDSAKPESVDPGEWTVILEPAAFGELFIYLSHHFSAQAFDEGSSFLSDGLDRQYLGDNVTILDDFEHPLAPGMPFDYEGQPTERLELVAKGIGKTVVTDSYWAHKLNRPNTGHALPGPNAYGPQARNLVVSPGSKPMNELIAETRRGLLISRFWYIRPVDQKKAIVTGMTRDGTFLIKDGEIAGGVHNLRFNQSIIESLRDCEFGNSLHRTGSYSYSVVVPAAKINNFRFSSGTSF
ncbi:MAG TPA: TldD/PmbA family protein [Candidatus Baltobacteraceae bacterium]|nr:TldD/PmbA family protein [Candidatus Baltobacteraceae bacterium]